MEMKETDAGVENSSNTPEATLDMLDSYWTDVEKLPVPMVIPTIDLDEFPEEHRIDMFHLSRDAWVSLYDPSALIKGLREGTPSSLQRKSLKDLRKHGLILRSAYHSLDGRHLSPENHWRFTKLLGELNDAYHTSHRAEDSERLANFVEGHYSSVERLDFFPASDESFRGIYLKELAEIDTFNKEDSLPARDFHQMRKLLRNTMNTFRLSGTVSHSPEMGKRARYMQNLNEVLGDTQDQLVQQHLQGQISYADTSVTVSSPVRAKIQGFIQANKP